MRVVRDPLALAQLVDGFRADGQIIGFVPTMGALHEGHLSLVRLVGAKADRVVVSVFVNPTQFGPNEDYLRYPRAETKDLGLLEKLDVDVAYVPSVSTMYHAGAAITVDPGHVGRMFEGQVRPDHYRGVLTIVAKLFHQVHPHIAVFGQKDAQQLFLVRQMVRDLNFPLTIIEGETTREADGLAMSSRNVYLKTAERVKATVLLKALTIAKTAYETGIRSLAQLKDTMADAVAVEHEVAIDYLTVVSEKTFTESDPVPESARIIGAIRLGSVRLIDNLSVRVA